MVSEEAERLIPQSFFQEDFRKMAFPVSLDEALESQPWHWHEEFEIFYCCRGNFTLGMDLQFHQLQEGEMAMVAGRLMHCLLIQPEAEVFSIKFSHKLLRNSPQELLIFLSQQNLSTFWTEADKRHVGRIVTGIRREFLRREPGWQSAVSSLLYQFLSYSVRHLPRQENCALLGTRRGSHQIYEILLYIAGHYQDENFSVRDCARHFNFNSNYFSTLFSKSTGVTFQQYLNSLRLRNFEYLLLNTDDPITEICSRAGFSSVKTLNRRFRAVWNMTPTQYRQRNRKSAHQRLPAAERPLRPKEPEGERV